MNKNKLTPTELAEIKKLFLTGKYSCRELAEMYGSTVWYVRRIADEALKDFKTKNK